jgi:HPt (histidine-containing phosphotransfer) domain-containing protein
VRAEELFSAIDAIAGSRAPAAPSPETPAPPPHPKNVSSVERSALLAAFGGRGDLVKEVIDVFLTDAPVMLARLNDAAQASNGAELAAAAHAIKGSAGLFSLGEAYHDARALELRVRGADLSAADRACQDIERSVSRLMTELESIRDTL